MMASIANNFRSHLAKIKFAKLRASELLSAFSPATENAIKSLVQAWEKVFDAICKDDESTLETLKNISSIMQRLSSSQQKIQAMELKNVDRIVSIDVCEEKQKLEIIKKQLDNEKSKLSEARENLRKGKLPCDVVKVVEEQLMLL